MKKNQDEIIKMLIELGATNGVAVDANSLGIALELDDFENKNPFFTVTEEKAEGAMWRRDLNSVYHSAGDVKNEVHYGTLWTPQISVTPAGVEKFHKTQANAEKRAIDESKTALKKPFIFFGMTVKLHFKFIVGTILTCIGLYLAYTAIT